MNHLVGVSEIADMLGVSKQRVGQIMQSYQDFPTAEAELTAGRIWARSAIEEWQARHPERKPGSAEQGAMFQRFTDLAKGAILLAQQEAVNFRHSYIGTEHLLLALRAQADSTLAGKALAGRDRIPLSLFRAKVEQLVGVGREPSPEPPKIPFTPRGKKVLELSLRAAVELRQDHISPEHILLGILREGEGVAIKVLRDLAIDPTMLREQLIHLISETTEDTTQAHALGRALEPVLERLDRIEQRLQQLPGSDP